jgi:hypothetical protein
MKKEEMVEIPWWIKLGFLLFGASQPLLGLPLIFLDGLFHTFTPDAELRKRSPDWIIARNVWDGDGLNHWIHKVMGIFLLLTSTWAFWKLFLSPPFFGGPKAERNAAVAFYVRVIMPMVLLIISLAITVRAYFEGEGGVAFL